MNDELNGRRLHHWVGKDRRADIAALADAIAATGELFDNGGAIVRLDQDGELVDVNRTSLHEFISQHLAAVRAVKRGTRWVREFYAYEFAQRPHPGPPRTEDHGKPEMVTHEPDRDALDQIYRHELWGRIPKVGS